jgi:hypothetical protein
MRWVVCVLLAIAACKESRAPEHDPPVQPGSAVSVPPSSGDAWQRIEALAVPAGTPGPSTDLERALPLAAANSDAWRELEYRRPAPPLSEYPQGAEAVAALKAWANAKGGLPPMPAPTKLGPVTMNIFSLGSTAVAVASSRDDLAPPIYLGTLLITHGRDLLEVQMGASLLSHARYKADELAGYGQPKPDLIPVPSLDLVRVLAAEAIHSRAMLEWSQTPAGKQEMVNAVAAAGSESRAIATELLGKDPMSMIPNEAEAAAYKVFWLAALEGAQRGEPAAVTIDRVRKAAEGAPSSIKDSVARIASVLDMLQSELDRVKNPPL